MKEILDDNFLKDLLTSKKKESLPVVVLKDTVVFPKLAMPLAVYRDSCKKAVESSQQNNGIALFVAQKKMDVKEIGKEDDKAGGYGNKEEFKTDWSQEGDVDKIDTQTEIDKGRD